MCLGSVLSAPDSSRRREQDKTLTHGQALFFCALEWFCMTHFSTAAISVFLFRVFRLFRLVGDMEAPGRGALVGGDARHALRRLLMDGNTNGGSGGGGGMLLFGSPRNVSVVVIDVANVSSSSELEFDVWLSPPLASHSALSRGITLTDFSINERSISC